MRAEKQHPHPQEAEDRWRRWSSNYQVTRQNLNPVWPQMLNRDRMLPGRTGPREQRVVLAGGLGQPQGAAPPAGSVAEKQWVGVRLRPLA